MGLFGPTVTSLNRSIKISSFYKELVNKFVFCLAKCILKAFCVNRQIVWMIFETCFNNVSQN